MDTRTQKAQYGKNEAKRTPWGPSDIPWSNPKSDSRNKDLKNQESHTQLCRRIIQAAYEYHNVLHLTGESDGSNVSPESESDSSNSNAPSQSDRTNAATIKITQCNSTNATPEASAPQSESTTDEHQQQIATVVRNTTFEQPLMFLWKVNLMTKSQTS
ncbi:uncharacterized protein LOC141915157 [Tubulanus polymorphus]|uniref:uncharacterized protein LOC141915157 n=1 Tax=Tubulanus polymorphus TaxID=672921 RepID=UPI003DA29E18